MWGPSLQLDDRHRIQIPISERSSGWATNYISIRGERIIQYSSEALVFILVWHMAQLVSHSNCPPIQLVSKFRTICRRSVSGPSGRHNQPFGKIHFKTSSQRPNHFLACAKAGSAFMSGSYCVSPGMAQRHRLSNQSIGLFRIELRICLILRPLSRQKKVLKNWPTCCGTWWSSKLCQFFNLWK